MSVIHVLGLGRNYVCCVIANHVPALSNIRQICSKWSAYSSVLALLDIIKCFRPDAAGDWQECTVNGKWQMAWSYSTTSRGQWIKYLQYNSAKRNMLMSSTAHINRFQEDSNEINEWSICNLAVVWKACECEQPARSLCYYHSVVLFYKDRRELAVW